MISTRRADFYVGAEKIALRPPTPVTDHGCAAVPDRGYRGAFAKVTLTT